MRRKKVAFLVAFITAIAFVPAGAQTLAALLASYDVTFSDSDLGFGVGVSGVCYHAGRDTLMMIDNNAHSIWETDTSGSLIREINLSGFPDPEGIAHVPGTDYYFIVDEDLGGVTRMVIPPGTSDITIYQSSGVFLSICGNLEGCGYNPTNNTVYVTKEGVPLPRGIHRVPLDASYLPTGYFLDDPFDITNHHGDVAGVCALPDGGFLVVNEIDNVLMGFSSCGQYLSQLSLGGMTQPEGVAVDGNDDIYVVGESRQLYVFHSNGNPPGPKSISIYEPVADAHYESNGEVDIRFNTQNIFGPVRIDYHDGSDWYLIEGFASSTQRYAWQIPGLDIAACKVRVTALGCELDAPSDESGIFSIGDAVNNPPAAFSLVSPTDTATVSRDPDLDWADATDPDPGDVVTYTVQVDNDSGFGNPEVDVSGLTASGYAVPEGILAASTLYYWKVKATDNDAVPLDTWSTETWTFTTNANSSPSAFDLTSPNGVETATTPVLDWGDATDPNPGDVVTYTVLVDNDSGFGSPEVDVSGLSPSTYTVPGGTLADHTVYYWKVKASDDFSPPGDRWSNQTWSFTTNDANEAPSAFNLLSPPDTATVSSTPSLDWENAADPDPGDTVTYGVQVDDDSGFNNPEVDVLGISSSTYAVPGGALADLTLYYWRALADDGEGGQTWSTQSWSFTTTTVPADIVIESWESGLGSWEGINGGTAEISQDHVTHGSNCVKWTNTGSPPESYPGFAIELVSYDWSSYADAYIKLDIYSEVGAEDNDRWRFKVKAAGETVQFTDYNGPVLTPGWQTYVIPVASFGFTPAQLADMTNINFWLSTPATVGDIIYYDNLRVSQTPDAIDSYDLALNQGNAIPYPNPADSLVILPVPGVSKAVMGSFNVTIHDVAGRSVRAFSIPGSTQGRLLHWDGRNESGRQLPSGMYICILEGNGYRNHHRIILTR